jgi:hypothetical protein
MHDLCPGKLLTLSDAMKSDALISFDVAYLSQFRILIPMIHYRPLISYVISIGFSWRCASHAYQVPASRLQSTYSLVNSLNSPGQRIHCRSKFTSVRVHGTNHRCALNIKHSKSGTSRSRNKHSKMLSYFSEPTTIGIDA